MTEADSEPNWDDHEEELRCQKCMYRWTYTGQMWRASCPRCGAKVKTSLYGELGAGMPD